MDFLKRLFKSPKRDSISYQDFWDWFQKSENAFFRAVKNDSHVEDIFFEPLSQKLNQIKEDFYFLVGMSDENEAELILTADGLLKNFLFVEELVSHAPKLKHWKITALKPSMTHPEMSIQMEGFDFSTENIFFYYNEFPHTPDEIDVVIVCTDWNEENAEVITSGVFIFLENYLGELNLATKVDTISVVSKKEAKKELIPIEKLQSFLAWREKEFVEKYEGLRYDTGNDHYSALEAELENGKPLVAIINSTLLNWDRKASHPWILVVTIPYDGSKDNGMPNQETYALMDEVEDEISDDLQDADGYLNIGRETADGVREIYFACNEFRKPSKVLHRIKNEFGEQLVISFDIYKDKYWQSFNRFL